MSLDDCVAMTPGKKSLAFSHGFGSSGVSQEVRIVGSAKRTAPNEGYPFPASMTCPYRLPLHVPLW